MKMKKKKIRNKRDFKNEKKKPKPSHIHQQYNSALINTCCFKNMHSFVWKKIKLIQFKTFKKKKDYKIHKKISKYIK